MELLQKGKTQYGWPPCAKQFRTLGFYIGNISILLQNILQMGKLIFILEIFNFQ